MDKNKQVTPAAKPAAKTRRVAKPVAAKPLPGLPSDPTPPVAAPAAKPVVAKAPEAVPAPRQPSVEPASLIPPVVVPEPDTVEAAPAPVTKAPSPAPAAPTPEPDAAPAISSPTAAVPAESSPKEIIMDATSTVENAAQDTAAKTQAMFGEAQARTQDAMNKSAKLFEDMIAFNKDNVEAMVESSKIAAKGAQTLGQGAADYAKRSFETATQTMQTLSSVKSPTEFMKLQSDFARSAFDSMVAETSRSTETMMKLAGEIAQPLSNRFAVAAEKMKTVA
ncbi:TIGR01841 family phasin [Sphingomonas pseudosanguinis]|uniref:Phasin family protein n=1 Tax=Sphingomonas pseudosanguinis TaxID=413712 RepID=A0A7W6AB14_9SPHN|nr:phasin family protein [Sphingomonas pseudosanguinis]MBN3537052.1 TIGR01841 family phasin [Sphingomonas pseudosanguinis]